MKKLFSLIMVLALLCTVTAFAAAEEPVVLNVFYGTSRPMNDATELTHQYILENLGVDVHLEQGDSSNFNQQLALRMTDADTPDIVWCDYNVWKDYATQGAWADISGYISEEKTPDLMKYVGTDWVFMTVDDEILGVPSELSVPSSHVVFVRKDWLDKLGLDVPVTLDEFTNVMRAFTTQDPDGNGINDTYGLSAAGATYLSFLMGAFGASTERDNFLNDDGTVTTNAISPEYRAALQYLHDIYAEGLIDPELFTMSEQSQAQAKWGRGAMGLWSAWFSHASNAYSRYDFASLQPDAVVEAILPPVGENGMSGNLYSAPFTSVVGISAKSSPEKVEAAIKYLNFQASNYGFRVVMYGVEDEFFDWDPETDTTTWYWGVNDNKSKSGKYEVTDMEVYKMLFHENIQEQTNALTDTPYSRIRVAGSNMRFTEPTREDIFCMYLTDEYVEYHADLDNYFNTNMLAFIMGEKNLDSDWDAYVQEYLNMGGEEERESQLAEYNAAHGTNATFAQ
ncbi:MAG: extracellular solute-binding protein [Clostridia bacterium]|nr:extracellular solute-binding protein [Clostridia bacterium]